MAQMGLPLSVVQEVRRRIAMQLMQQKQMQARIAQKRALDILAAQQQQAQQPQLSPEQAALLLQQQQQSEAAGNLLTDQKAGV